MQSNTILFFSDIKWILHNCIIFNSLASKLTSVAKSLVKICKHEMQEIENCPDCYLNAHTKKDSWFVAACVSHSWFKFISHIHSILLRFFLKENVVISCQSNLIVIWKNQIQCTCSINWFKSEKSLIGLLKNMEFFP